MIIKKTVLEVLIEFELKLQSKSVRKDVKKIEKLLHDNFIEIGSQGSTYSKQDILERLPQSKFLTMEPSDFKGISMSNEFFLLHYNLKTLIGESENIYSKRSSIWKNENNFWKMYFHQSTLISSFE